MRGGQLAVFYKLPRGKSLTDAYKLDGQTLNQGCVRQRFPAAPVDSAEAGEVFPEREQRGVNVPLQLGACLGRKVQGLSDGCRYRAHHAFDCLHGIAYCIPHGLCRHIESGGLLRLNFGNDGESRFPPGSGVFVRSDYCGSYVPLGLPSRARSCAAMPVYRLRFSVAFDGAHGHAFQMWRGVRRL